MGKLNFKEMHTRSSILIYCNFIATFFFLVYGKQGGGVVGRGKEGRRKKRRRRKERKKRGNLLFSKVNSNSLLFPANEREQQRANSR
jgi:hypothetical protein